MPKVYLVSDQPVLLRGFEHVLAASGFEITGSSPASPNPASPNSGGFRASVTPDLILLDVTGGLTFSTLSDLHNEAPHCPVVLWSDPLPLELTFKTLEFGVRGIVQRHAAPEQLSESLRKVASGELQIGFTGTGDTAKPTRQPNLTPREREIVALLRGGLRNKQIAIEMGITEGTVKIYLFRLFHKLGVRNRFDLARCGALDHIQFSVDSAAAGKRAALPEARAALPKTSTASRVV